MIEFKGVTYQFPDGTRALNKISLKISQGEKVALVGANGSGKTTFALHLNGILVPSRGTVNIDELNPAIDKDNQELKHQVGMVFQNPDNQLVSTTVERELAFSLENMNVGRREMKKRVGLMLDFFGLAKYRNSLTSNLSGGEKQRLALAAVLITNPGILVLDEPDSYLDQAGCRALNDAIRMLISEKEDITVIRITQYASVAEKYDRLVIFGNGSILRDGKPDDIFSDGHLCQTAMIDVPLKYRINNAFDFPRRQEDIKKNNGISDGARMAIVLHDICFGYENNSEKEVLKDINLEIKSGKVYGLVGPTGSGKSTLIQLMANLLRPKKGEIKYEHFANVPGAMVVSFQQAERQFFLDTVNKEIRFGAENLKHPDPQRIADECYRLVGLDKKKFAERDPFRLSGGEKRRLSFATILSLEPSFIFFDEPTCALDFSGIQLFKKLVIELRRQNIGVVIVSHQGDIILELADEVFVLENGKIRKYENVKGFFAKADYSDFLMSPELITYQGEKYGDIKYFSEEELFVQSDLRNL